MSWVWDHGPEDKSELLVLLALADCCDDNGRCSVSISNLSELTRMTERGARAITARLVKRRYLKKIKNGRRNHYKILTRPVLVDNGRA